MKISVITINYNNGEQLEATIQSVVSNVTVLRELLGEKAEYIVIDGGSADCSVSVLQKYSEYISYWISEKDKGIYHAMNKGISVAQGEYCLFLNSGDTFYEDDTLKKALLFLKEDFVCGNAVLKYAGGINEWSAPQTVNTLFFMQRFSVCHQSLFIRTELLKSHPYNETLMIVADYEQMFYEIAVNHRSYKKIDLTICYYGCDGVSSDHEKADAEKRNVINEFRYLGYIVPDELWNVVSKLKVGTRKYRLLLSLAKCLASSPKYWVR